MVTHRCEKIWFYSHDVMNVRTYVQRTYVRTSVRPFMYANVTSTRNHITGSSLELIQEAILHLTLTRLQHTSLILHINVFTGEKCLRMSRAIWHVTRFRDYHWLSRKKHSLEEQKNGCRLRIGSLLVSVLFRAMKASFNASFKWNVFLENVYVV